MIKTVILCLSIFAHFICEARINTPTVKISSAEYPIFSDDLDFKEMDLAIKRQLDAFRRAPLVGEIRFGDDLFNLKVLKDTMILFKKIVKDRIACSETKIVCDSLMRESIIANFNIYIPESNSVHFTAYYSPTLDASVSQSEVYRYPIYKMPSDPLLRWLSRIDIDFDHKLRGHDLELYYVKDLFDIYLLHVEGGGAVTFPDGKIKYLSYAGTNKKSFRFLSKYMHMKGWIDDRSIKSQRTFLNANPGLWREVYSYCPSYVFFENSYTPPLGLEDIPLTDNRSLAQDKKFYPRKGILSFVKASRPVDSSKLSEEIEVKLKNYSRFYIDQDTGGAIKGEARADLYFGFGEYAKVAADSVDVYGSIYYLVKK